MRSKSKHIESYIERLERENERLDSHHSWSEEEFGRLNESAEKWFLRAYIAEKIARFLNARNPFWFDEDLKKEIRIISNSYFERWKSAQTGRPGYVKWRKAEEKKWEKDIRNAGGK